MEFIELLKIIFLGIVEGITEWLPISSTGHMILIDEFIKPDFSPDFMKLFIVVIQLGAILAVVVLFIKKLWPFSADKKSHYIKKDIWTLWFKILVACIPTGIAGILLEDIIDEALGSYIVVAITLIVYGIAFIIIEKLKKGKEYKINQTSDITYVTALCIGLFQVLAMIPGTSRSGATILGAMLIGASRTVAAEFTFFLAIPTMAGASLVKLLKYDMPIATNEILVLALGMITAFIVSFFAIKFLVNFVKKHNFVVFGWYRIVLGIIVLVYFALV